MAQAAAWVARLQRDDLGEADGVEFDAWLAASPENRAAYRQALAIWHEFDARAGGRAGNDARRRDPQAPPARAACRRRGAGWSARGGLGIAAGLALTVLPTLSDKPPVRTLRHRQGPAPALHARRRHASSTSTPRPASAWPSAAPSGGCRWTTARRSSTWSHDERRPVHRRGRRADRCAWSAPSSTSATGGGQLTVTVARGKVEVRPMPRSASRVYLLTPGPAAGRQRDRRRARLQRRRPARRRSAGAPAAWSTATSRSATSSPT